MIKFLKTNDLLSQVYNDGIIKLYDKKQQTDAYGTPIKKYEEVLQMEPWFRVASSRAEDVFYARSLDKDISLKVAIQHRVKVDTAWLAKIGDQSYEIYLADYNPKNDETMISLMEVANE